MKKFIINSFTQVNYGDIMKQYFLSPPPSPSSLCAYLRQHNLYTHKHRIIHFYPINISYFIYKIYFNAHICEAMCKILQLIYTIQYAWASPHKIIQNDFFFFSLKIKIAWYLLQYVAVAVEARKRRGRKIISLLLILLYGWHVFWKSLIFSIIMRQLCELWRWKVWMFFVSSFVFKMFIYFVLLNFVNTCNWDWIIINWNKVWVMSINCS